MPAELFPRGANGVNARSSPVWGERAVVIGAGIAGLASAAALSPHFERVIVFERDALPETVEPRPSIPQGRHVHTLLAGGLSALERLLPELSGELIRGGAVRMCCDLDFRIERLPYEPVPARDFGFHSYTLSRPLLEHCLRRALLARPNVSIEPECRVLGLIPRGESAAPRALTYKRGRAHPEQMACDLVLDCSGRGEITLQFLRQLGWPEPEETQLGIDVAYTTRSFARPPAQGRDWKAVLTFGHAPLSSKGGLLAPIEGERWLVSLGGRHSERPPPDAAGYMEFLHSLRTPTLARALAAVPALEAEPAHFVFPASTRRHFERMPAQPLRLLALGDARCRFNPLYGQGMSVAAQQARALAECLQRRAAGDPWPELSAQFTRLATQIADQAWNMSAISDFLFRQTTGPRPPDLRERLVRIAALQQLVGEDPEIHRLAARVNHLLDPPSVLKSPEIEARVRKILERGPSALS